jgi:hypothetical protein
LKVKHQTLSPSDIRNSRELNLLNQGATHG